MAKIPFGFGVGGGDSSDDCTATAADILESKTAIYNGSDDDAASGSMKDYSGTTTSVSAALNSSSARVQMAIPNTGKYDTAAILYTPYSSMASLLGLTAAKLKTGNTILGITGTVKEYQALSGSFALTTSGHSTSTWVGDGGRVSLRSVSLSDFGYSSLSFTPVYVLAFHSGYGVWATANGCNLIDPTYYYYYSASDNSQYEFSSTAINLPLNYSGSNLGTCFWWIIGYN